MKKRILIAIIAISSVIVGTHSYLFSEVAEVKNTGNPAKGKLNFNLEKIWELEGVGDTMFANVRRIREDGSGTVYWDDEKNNKFYIFSGDGKLIKSFGKAGEGPGEIRDFYRATMYVVDKSIIIEEPGKLHYFTNRGGYIQSYPVSRRRIPVFFLDADEYITAPLNLLQAPDGRGKIRRINIKTGKEQVIRDFSMFEGGAINDNNVRAAVTSPALTPIMTIGYHKDRLYYGMNDRYKIHVSDMKGNILRRISLERKKRVISDKVKVDRLVEVAQGRAPKEILVKLAKTMPNEMTHFVALRVHNGLLYAFTSYYVRQNGQRIDIFSLEGKYLYRAFIRVPEDLVIERLPYIGKEHVYMVLQNEEGDQSVAKYKINLPGG